LTLIATIVVCAHLAVVGGDTLKCDSQLLRLLGEGTPFVSGIDAPELRTWKCQKERKLAHLARMRLKDLVTGRQVKIISEGRDNTEKHRPLVNVYLPDGREAGKVLLKEGFARPWRPHHHIDWCS
jgi:endonuclease YncB( thermonuclease family)